MLADNALLTVLGRRGRGAVVEALRADPHATWTVREIARAADVAPMTASRAIKELAALGVLDVFRPGRDMVVRWEQDAAASRVLADLVVPDFKAEGVAQFAEAYPRRVVQWVHPDDEPSDPLTPARLAVIVRSGEDEALDDVGPALDAVHAAGWPRPEVTVFRRDDLDLDDPVAMAVLEGRPVTR